MRFLSISRHFYQNLTGSDIVAAVLDKDAPKKRRGRKKKKPASGNGAVTDAIPIRGLIPGMAVHFANCCHPLPGDRIIGIQTRGKGVSVHTIDCESLESFQETPERWVDLGWDLGSTPETSHVGRLTVIVANKRGTLARDGGRNRRGTAPHRTRNPYRIYSGF